MSSGDSSRVLWSRAGCLFSWGGESSLSEAVCDASCCIIAFRLIVLSTFGTDLEKNLGIGKDDAAGDAWNVGPAYALAGI